LRFPCFSDDFQGFACSVLAAALGALPETRSALSEHRILILGDGPNRVSIAEMFAAAMAQDSKKMVKDARQSIFLADHLGLVTSTSEHPKEEHDEMREVLLYSKDIPSMKELETVRSSVHGLCLCPQPCATGLPEGCSWPPCSTVWLAPWLNQRVVHACRLLIS
jgi:malic enzyme